jgi:hypothetical protein
MQSLICRVVTIALLFCGVSRAQTQTADDKTLETVVFAAHEQASDFIEAHEHELRSKAIAGDSKARELVEKIDVDKKRQNRWEISAWSLANSDLHAGESISLELGSGAVAVSGTVRTAAFRGLPLPPGSANADERVVYMVYAPPQIRSRILMEGLREELSSWTSMLEFDGKNAENDGFWISWKSAWFDAESIFCKYNPGAQFNDLNGDKQACNPSPTSYPIAPVNQK